MEEDIINNDFGGNEPPQDNLPDKPKNIWLFTGLLLLLFLLLGSVFAWYFLFKDNRAVFDDFVKQESAPSAESAYRDDFEKAITEYLEVQAGINDEVKKNLTLSVEIASGTKIATDEPKVLGVSNFQKDELNRSKRIARGVSTFWEIGRDKHIAEAPRINKEDLEYISLARQGVNFALVDLNKLATSIPKNHAAETRFAGKLTQYYQGLEKFLYQLKLYKEFNGNQIKEVSDIRITEFSEKMMDYYQRSFGLNDETKFQYLASTRGQAEDIYKEGVTVLEDSVVNLEDSLIPLDFVDPDILAELVSLRIELYGALTISFQQSADNLKQNNTTMSEESKNTVTYKNLLRIKREVDQSLLRLKVSSNISNVFNEVALIDKEIKDTLPNIKKKYNFLIKNNQPYLRDLMAEYVRGKSEMMSQFEEYVETAEKELPSFKLGVSTVTLNIPIPKLKISLITNKECNKGVIFNLKSPSGSIVSSKNLFLYDNIIYGTSFNTHFFVITNPETGKWEESVKLPIGCDDFRFEATAIK
ncbi:hypothetical protein KAJ61_00910 [Candidatus Parcubacteria bacterium]|nr:hypothetical protein [Candidatus Parcubacteria bacterium]